MNRIIDTDELEKLLSSVTIDTFAGEPYVTGLTEIYALIANSPQADGMVLDERMKQAGMISATEIMNGTSLDKWLAHKGVVDLDSYAKWLEVKRLEFIKMQAELDLSKEHSDLYEWIVAHVAVFTEAHVNFRQAMLSAYKPQADDKDNCEVCKGAKGGVKGNENIVNGKVMCDYCHAEQPQADDVRKDAERYRYIRSLMGDVIADISVSYFAGVDFHTVNEAKELDYLVDQAIDKARE